MYSRGSPQTHLAKKSKLLLKVKKKKRIKTLHGFNIKKSLFLDSKKITCISE